MPSPPKPEVDKLYEVYTNTTKLVKPPRAREKSHKRSRRVLKGATESRRRDERPPRQDYRYPRANYRQREERARK